MMRLLPRLAAVAALNEGLSHLLIDGIRSHAAGVLVLCRECECLHDPLHYNIKFLFTCRHTARDFTHSVSGAVLVHYPSQELAEAAFDVALRAGHVEVL